MSMNRKVWAPSCVCVCVCVWREEREGEGGSSSTCYGFTNEAHVIISMWNIVGTATFTYTYFLS